MYFQRRNFRYRLELKGKTSTEQKGEKFFYDKRLTEPKKIFIMRNLA